MTNPKDIKSVGVWPPGTFTTVFEASSSFTSHSAKHFVAAYRIHLGMGLSYV